ncbi:NAD(P)-dependent alcohol dehydrogenase [Nocardioides anomalus]|uniref:NAD(P)-dependent alcohol dehydrogenase n=1 Tax=Nocardioides anomalus TaxID=2712223 RepID=A0A6G6WAD3_9ACTN|nr:NAD(P)-dependent alcohol dehydrogenase [Nocardioides anomalus]QIG42192.1 NAD(P)-dependent alcohol dehydrogenase [Nocardioides anomalus]
MQTRAAVVEAQGQPFTLSDVELEEPRADEVLVRMVATGLCHTDLTMGSFLPPEMFPNVFGHEGAGVVERVGADVAGLEAGDHVVLSFRSCRDCAKCRAGLVGYCDSHLLLNYMGMRLDGSQPISRDGEPLFGSFFGQSSLAAHALAYADNCVKVDPALDLTLLAPYGCGFQTGAGTVLTVLRPRPDECLVVYGAGAVGLAAVAAARAEGVECVVAVDPLAGRRAVAERLGATVVDPAEAADVVARVKELTGGGAAYGIDTTAIPAVIKQAQQSLGIRGTLVALGLGAEEFALDAIDLLQAGKTVKASIEGDADPQEMVPRLLAMRAEGRFPLDDLVATYPAEAINDAVADVGAGTVVKPVLVW